VSVALTTGYSRRAAAAAASSVLRHGYQRSSWLAKPVAESGLGRDKGRRGSGEGRAESDGVRNRNGAVGRRAEELQR